MLHGTVRIVEIVRIKSWQEFQRKIYKATGFNCGDSFIAEYQQTSETDSANLALILAGASGKVEGSRIVKSSISWLNLFRRWKR